MFEYESFSFNRIFQNEKIEFFFIVGVNNHENFTEIWDGRDTKLLGYLTICTDPEVDKEHEQLNLIYLIEEVSLDTERIIKHTKKFIAYMSITNKYLDIENVKIYYTQKEPYGIIAPYIDFIKSITHNEIPNEFLDIRHK